MPLTRLGRVNGGTKDPSSQELTHLPWAESTAVALDLYREQLPSADERARVAEYRTTPREFLENPHLRVEALENELAHSFDLLWRALEETVDVDTACRISYAAGMIHGKRRLGTFLAGRGSGGGAESMAMWQDTAHSSAGPRHTTALFARYSEELVEVVRTDDSFGTTRKAESPARAAFFDGFIDGYRAVDPALIAVEEMTREAADGTVETVHRFWYRPAAEARRDASSAP
ncbi:hypothetical protein [Nocardia farcinica]|uniref:hypothetical protein n=1 Tax=Nocardia farcinica TaxID=37329 RepID=UPI0018949E9E|nr:hypothetical protein [Nocardia farcinica]MBF6271596.1 hypothetical protein [Nocardia farcinica]MCZ9328971.1 hypothetical protein [Nocardia farcinica]